MLFCNNLSSLLATFFLRVYDIIVYTINVIQKGIAMINKINSTDAITAKNSSVKAATTFTGSAQVVKKEMYAVTDTFAKLVEKRTNKGVSLTETLSKLLRRPAEELKRALNIEDMEKFNAKFKLDSEDLMNKKFKNSLTEFLKEKNIISKDNEFQSLPAKMLVLKKGDAQIDDLITGADRIVLHNGVGAKAVKGKRVIIRNLDNKMDVKGEYVNVKDSILSDVTSTTDIYGKNLSSKKATSEVGGVYLSGEANNVETLAGNWSIEANNLSSKTTTSEFGGVSLKGEANNVETLTAQKSIISTNLTSKTSTAKEGGVSLKGEANNVETLTAKGDISASNLTSKIATSEEGGVYLKGKTNNVATLLAKEDIEATNLNSKTVISQDGGVRLAGNANNVETLTVKADIDAGNLTGKTATSKAGGIVLGSEANKVEILTAKGNIYANNLTSKTTTSQEGIVSLTGEANSVEMLKAANGPIFAKNLTAKNVTAQSFVPSGDTFISGKIDADTSVLFKLKNQYNKFVKSDKS
jgi:hypothetical protein